MDLYAGKRRIVWGEEGGLPSVLSERSAVAFVRSSAGTAPGEEPTWPRLYATRLPVAVVQCGAVVWADVNRAALPLEAQPCALMQQLWAHALLS